MLNAREVDEVIGIVCEQGLSGATLAGRLRALSGDSDPEVREAVQRRLARVGNIPLVGSVIDSFG